MAHYTVGNLSPQDELYVVRLLGLSQISLNIQPHHLTMDFRSGSVTTGHMDLFGQNLAQGPFGLTGGPVTGLRIETSLGLYMDITGISLSMDVVNATFLRGDYDGFIRAGLTGDDTIFGGSQPDVLSGYAGNDVVFGLDGADRINGGQGSDLLFGNAGNDVLSGDAGDDRLVGGAGNDTLSGGDGLDIAEYGWLARFSSKSTAGFGGTLRGPDGTDQIVQVEQLKFLDGTLHIGSDSGAARAARLYEAALDRPADAIGLSFWTGALASGRMTAQQAAGSFVDSAEFRAEYGELGHRDYVAQLYRNVMGREGDAGGIAFWTGRLDQGSDRGTVLLGFSDSAELVRRDPGGHNQHYWVVDQDTIVVQRGYAAILDRTADSQGLAYWLQQLDNGLGQDALIQGFLDSREFHGNYAHLSGRDFVAQLYRNAMDREGDAGGIDHWTAQLQSGALSKAAIAAHFAFSDEMTLKLIPVLVGPELL